jgi:transposase
MNATPDIDYKRISEEQQVTITLLQHRLDKLEKMIFGSRHERFVAPVATTQISLDLKADEVATVSVIDEKKITYTRTNLAVEKKPLVHPGRGKLPDHLRREDIILEPDNIPEGSIKIGELITEQLECT